MPCVSIGRFTIEGEVHTNSHQRAVNQRALQVVRVRDLIQDPRDAIELSGVAGSSLDGSVERAVSPSLGCRWRDAGVGEVSVGG